MTKIIANLYPACRLLVVALLVQACSSGSGGSDVGSRENILPTARAQVVNVGMDGAFREGSEVLLSGSASEDGDGPILDWDWTQTGGPTVLMVERTSNVVSFTAPDVAAPTSLSFQLEVTDSDNEKATASVNVNVIPAQDADGFLTLSLRSTDPRRNAFTIVPGLVAGTGQDEPFTLSVRAYLIYPITGSPEDCQTADLPTDGSVPPMIGACSVALLEDLTPDTANPGQLGSISSAWIARPASEAQATDASGIVDSVVNPRFAFRVPRIDIDDFNQQFLPSQRDQMLDSSAIGRVKVALRIEHAADVAATSAGIVGVTSPNNNMDKGQFLFEQNSGSGAPITSWVALGAVERQIATAESQLTGEVYARTIDPGNTRTTLNDWLCLAGFAEPAGCGPLPVGETRRITLLQDALVGASTPDGEFAHAVYLNNYDLGFGRDMFNRTEVSPTNTGNVYSWVNNYATLEGAIRRQQPIVTVVMEYSPPEDANGDPIPNAASFTKFFTYTPDGSGDSVLVHSMNFDGRGELPTPGNCVACHGGDDPGGANPPLPVIELLAGASDSTGAACTAESLDPVCYTYYNGGNVNATFLPWDVDSLLFADDDPAILNAPVGFDGQTLLQELEAIESPIGIRKSEQVDQITRLNESALATFAQEPVRNAPGIELLEHWYGNPVDMTMNPPMIVGSYDDTTAAPGWRAGVTPAGNTNEAGSDELYTSVYARNCRMCHTSISDPDLQFNEYTNFIDRIGCGNDLTTMPPEPPNSSCGAGIYTRGIMPAARLTMDRFWTDFDGNGIAGDLLETHLKMVQRVDMSTDLTASEAAANITIAPSTTLLNGTTVTAIRNSLIRLSGETSDFANTFEWSEGAGYPVSGPPLVGANTDQVAFIPDAPGSYPVDLTINGSAMASVTFDVPNYLPQAVADTASAAPRTIFDQVDARDVEINFLDNDRFQLEVCGGACPPAVRIENADDLPISISNVNLIPDFDPDGVLTLDPGALGCALDTPAGCVDDRLIYRPAIASDTYTDVFEYTISDTDLESDTTTITVQVQLALQTMQTAPDVVSDRTATFTVSATGGAQVASGSRYSIAVVGGIGQALGTVTIPPGNESFNSSTTVTYLSTPAFRTGPDSFRLVVTDNGGASSEPVDFAFDVGPQDAFNTVIDSTRPTVLQILRSQPPSSSVSCVTGGCHNGSSSAPDFTAGDSDALFDLLNSENLVIRTSGNELDSPLYCVPTVGVCNPDQGHVGTNNALNDATDRAVIARWLQEGGQRN